MCNLVLKRQSITAEHWGKGWNALPTKPQLGTKPGTRGRQWRSTHLVVHHVSATVLPCVFGLFIYWLVGWLIDYLLFSMLSNLGLKRRSRAKQRGEDETCFKHIHPNWESNPSVFCLVVKMTYTIYVRQILLSPLYRKLTNIYRQSLHVVASQHCLNKTVNTFQHYPL